MLAVESKWSAKDWTSSSKQLHDAAAQARGHARRLSLWQDLKALDIGPVGSVVFLWGPAARSWTAPFDLDGTTIVPSQHAARWRAALPEGRLTREQVDAGWQILDRHCGKADPHATRTHPSQLSLGEWAGRAGLNLAAGSAGFLTVTKVVATGLPWGLSLVWWALMLTVGVGVCRIPAVRYLGLAWTGGVGATALFSAILIVSWAI